MTSFLVAATGRPVMQGLVGQAVQGPCWRMRTSRGGEGGGEKVELAQRTQAFAKSGATEEAVNDQGAGKVDHDELGCPAGGGP
jgi:hypothetical protein